MNYFTEVIVTNMQHVTTDLRIHGYSNLKSDKFQLLLCQCYPIRQRHEEGLVFCYQCPVLSIYDHMEQIKVCKTIEPWGQ